jgi:hypothetical protein
MTGGLAMSGLATSDFVWSRVSSDPGPRAGGDCPGGCSRTADMAATSATGAPAEAQLNLSCPSPVREAGNMGLPELVAFNVVVG